MFTIFNHLWSFPSGSDGNEFACNAGDPGSIPESGRFPGEEPPMNGLAIYIVKITFIYILCFLYYLSILPLLAHGTVYVLFLQVALKRIEGRTLTLTILSMLLKF